MKNDGAATPFHVDSPEVYLGERPCYRLSMRFVPITETSSPTSGSSSPGRGDDHCGLFFRIQRGFHMFFFLPTQLGCTIFVCGKGEYDALLSWPMSETVRLSVLQAPQNEGGTTARTEICKPNLRRVAASYLRVSNAEYRRELEAELRLSGNLHEGSGDFDDVPSLADVRYIGNAEFMKSESLQRDYTHDKEDTIFFQMEYEPPRHKRRITSCES
jgi:hypothetical protein